MVRTRSSRERMPKESPCDQDNGSGPPVLARIQLRLPNNDKLDVYSDVTSPIGDSSKIASTEKHYNDDATNPDSHVIGQNVVYSSVCLTEQYPLAQPSVIARDPSNDMIRQQDHFETARGSTCEEIGTTLDKNPTTEQLPLRFLDEALSERTHPTNARHADMQKACEVEKDIAEHEFSEDCRQDGTDHRMESEDPFAWLIRTAELIVIDPEDTIPLTCIREVTKAGIAKLERSFLGEGGSSMLKGVSSAGSQAVVVLIPDDLLHIVRTYFLNTKGLSEENAYAISTSRKWYGVVDGAHRRKFLLERGQRYPDHYKGYGWIVMRVGWQPLEVLRAFARARNELQRGEHLVDFTVYDVFKNLKQCANEVALSEGLAQGHEKNRGFMKRVADQYCGGVNTANKMTRQLAGIAVVLSWPVIKLMGEILYKEYPDTVGPAIGQDSAACYDADRRLCRNLFTRSTFRGATTFKSVASEQDQMNTLRRLESLASQRNFKSVSKTELEVQAKKAIAAKREVEKMEKKLQGHEWPTDMAAVKQTLLATVMLDDQVEQNKDSDEILPELEELWKSQFPLAAELEAANRKSDTADNDVASSPNLDHSAEVSNINVSVTDAPLSPPSEDECCFSKTHGEFEEEDNPADADKSAKMPRDTRGTGSSPGQTENLSLEDESRDEIEGESTEGEKYCPLKQLSIRAENKSWREFRMTLITEDLFDFIYADPQQSLSASDLKQGLWTEFKDERKMAEFAKFCRITLRPGCYCFIFVTTSEHANWVAAFQKEGMKVMASPFMVIPSSESVRVTRLKDLPQPVGELAVVARTPGASSGFNINFNKAYSRIGCSYSKKFGIIDNVPRCMNPLRAHNSRAEVRPRERHPDLISEIMDTFCSPTGVVLAPFGGALTTGISCISTQRPCVVLEKDTYCFDLAIRRLQKLSRDQLISAD